MILASLLRLKHVKTEEPPHFSESASFFFNPYARTGCTLWCLVQ